MTSPPSAIAAFVPRLILHGLAGEGAPAQVPAELETTGFALFADLTGFTRYTEELVRQQGRSLGAEQLAHALNASMGRLVGAVAEHQGDVVAFAGDALLAIWPTPPGQDRRLTLRRLMATATAIRRIEQSLSAAGGVRLPVKIGLASGDIRVAHLGGTLGRRQLLVVGSAPAKAAQAASKARPGAACCDEGLIAEARALPGIELNEDDGELLSAAAIAAAPPAPIEASRLATQAYLPAAVHSRAVEAADGWMAEIRRVSVLFISLPELARPVSLQRMDALVREVQICLATFDGSLNKLVADEKGVFALAAFGLPPSSHETDPARATLAAMAIHEALAALGARCAIGVATGVAFCGAVGGEQRREYSLLGDVVNTAARLMSAAGANILCDAATRAAASGRVNFEELEPIQLKGKAGAVRVARPLSERPATLGDPAVVLGRGEELALMEGAVSTLAQGGPGAALVILGAPGLGKTHLARHMAAVARAAQIHPTLIAGDPIARLSPFHAWTPWLAEVLGPQRSLATLEEALRSRLGADDLLAEQAPLFAEILGLPIVESAATRALTGRARAEATIGALAGLATRVAQTEGPQLFLVEDAHWIDSLSLQVVCRLARDAVGSPYLVFCTSRPRPDLSEEAWSRLQDLGAGSICHLRPFSPEEACDLARVRLGVGDLPAAVADLIFQRSEGNPFFIEEILWHLWDGEVIAVVDGRCELRRPLEAQTFPETLHGLIASRFDRLAPGEQLTMKIASVVGPEFSLALVDAVHPPAMRGRGVRRNLERLVQLDVVTRTHSVEPERYRFNHVLVREAAYAMMPARKRADLHKELGQWLATHTLRQDPVAPSVIASHFEIAGLTRDAIAWYVVAANQAERSEADAECLGFLRAALRLAADSPQTPRADQAEWLRRSAELLTRLGRPAEALGALQTAAQLLGLPAIPTAFHAALSLPLALLRMGLRQIGPIPSPSAAQAQRALEAQLLRQIVDRSLELVGPSLAALLLTVEALSRVVRDPLHVDERAQLFAILSGLLDALGLRRLGGKLAAHAQSSLVGAASTRGRARVLARLALRRWDQGQHAAALDELDAALRLALSAGDGSTYCRYAPIGAAMAQLLRPAEAPERWAALQTLARQRGLARPLTLATAGLAYCGQETDRAALRVAAASLASAAERCFVAGALDLDDAERMRLIEEPMAPGPASAPLYAVGLRALADLPGESGARLAARVARRLRRLPGGVPAQQATDPGLAQTGGDPPAVTLFKASA